MSYVVTIATAVSDKLKHLPFEVAEFAWDRIEELLQDPVRLALPGRTRTRGGQRYQFVGTFEGTRYAFELAFRYLDTPDENQLHITHLQVERSQEPPST